MESVSTPPASSAPSAIPQTVSAKPPRDKTKTQGKVLMEITAVSGEYPSENIHRLILAPSYARKVVSTLIGDNFIKLVSAGGLKGYRLTPRGKKALITDNPARFAGLFSGTAETNKARTGYERRLRLHSLAEVCTLMLGAGVEIFADVKPKVYLPDVSDPPSQPSVTGTDGKFSRSSPPSIAAPCFYTSREQKGQGDNAIRGSRATGTLLTPTNVYAVYNTGRLQSRWSEKTEQRFKAQTQDYICRKLLSHQYNGAAVSGIMVGADLETLEKYLTAKEKEQTAYHFLTKVFGSFYFITNDIFGETQLKLLCDRDRTAGLKTAMQKGLLPPDTKHPIEHDAITEDGNPVLFCCLLDIPRLIRFRNGAALHDKVGKVIAFDFQLDMLGRYLGNTAEFVGLSFEKFVGRFFKDD